MHYINLHVTQLSTKSELCKLKCQQSEISEFTWYSKQCPKINVSIENSYGQCCPQAAAASHIADFCHVTRWLLSQLDELTEMPTSLVTLVPNRSHSGCVSYQGILSTPIPFVPWQSGLPCPRYNSTLKTQGQRSKSKVPQSAQCPVDSFP